MEELSFKHFFEEEESKHMAVLSNELGIEPKDLERSPMAGSFFSLGNNVYNLSAYQIVGYKRGPNGKPTHALIKTMAGGNRRKYRKDGDAVKRVEDEPDNKTYLVPMSSLDALMTKGLNAQPDAMGGMGGMGGAPPMPPGMGM